MPTDPRICALIPAWNEADRITETVHALRSLPMVGTILVVDDGSTDETAAVAKAAGAQVLSLDSNQGKSAAVSAGLRQLDPSFVLLIDADLGRTAVWAQALMAPVSSGQADMTIARFPVIPGRGGGMGLAVRAARLGTRLLGGQTLSAPLSGQRCLSRKALEAAFPLPKGFGLETALNIAVLKAGLRIVEIETEMDHRVTQNDWSGRRHRIRQLVHILMALLHAGLHYRR